MFRETFIEESVIRGQKIQHTTVFPHDAGEEELRLFPQRLPQVVVEIRKLRERTALILQVPQIQPLARKVFYDCIRTLVGEHPADLLFQHGRVAEFVLGCYLYELVVRNAAPKKE